MLVKWVTPRAKAAVDEISVQGSVFCSRPWFFWIVGCFGLGTVFELSRIITSLREIDYGSYRGGDCVCANAHGSCCLRYCVRYSNTVTVGYGNEVPPLQVRGAVRVSVASSW